LTNTNQMDLILCRNVLIYFSPTTTQHVVQRLHDALADDSWLIVGHAEPSQEVFRQFALCNFPDTVVYRKQAPEQVAPVPAVEWTRSNPASHQPLAHATQSHNLAPQLMPAPPINHQAPTAPITQPLAAARPLAAPPADAGYARALALTAAGEYDEAGRLLLALAAAPVSDGVAAYHLAQLLAGRGKLAEAERWVQVAVERAPLLAEAHYLHSLLLIEAGQPDAALTALRRCIYVDAEFELAHFSLAALYQQQRQAPRALRELQLTVSLLAGRPEAELLRGSEGFSVGRLRQIATTQVSALSAAA
jgi:chemotaxis protein methyltransferase CheR